MRWRFFGAHDGHRLRQAPAEHHRRIVRRSKIALLVVLAATFGGCGKGEVAFVKRPVLPIYVCPNGPGGSAARCAGRFDASQLVGMTLTNAERDARAHGFALRKVAPPRDVPLEDDFETNRLNIECSSRSRDCIVVRLAWKG
jgi:hypothetical protein